MTYYQHEISMADVERLGAALLRACDGHPKPICEAAAVYVYLQVADGVHEYPAERRDRLAARFFRLALERLCALVFEVGALSEADLLAIEQEVPVRTPWIS